MCMQCVYKHLSFFQEQGVQFIVRGRPKVYYGSLCVVSADNLGSLALGGFKESCSAHRMCRQCYATRDSAQKQVCMSSVFSAVHIIMSILCSLMRKNLC